MGPARRLPTAPRSQFRLAAFLLGAVLLAATGCSDGRVGLHHGPLGPASYTVELGVAGEPAVEGRERARMAVIPHDGGASLSLRIGDEQPITVDVVRAPSGGLELTAVQGLSPTTAGEADLASIVSQLDPPLPGAPVRLGSAWTRTRNLRTQTLDATLQTRMRAVRFRRAGGTDALEMRGTVTGRLRATGQTGTFEGTVTGTTTILWALGPGRLAASDTELIWSIAGSGDVVVRTAVSPAA